MAKPRISYPIGSVSSGTMQPEDLIPTFLETLGDLARTPLAIRSQRKRHLELIRYIQRRVNRKDYYTTEESGYDLEELTDVLNEYAAPYFYFGSHPGDGADYGFWLSESWDEDFINVDEDVVYPKRSISGTFSHVFTRDDMPCSIKVNDLIWVPNWFRGEVAHVNDHGNVTLYVKTARKLKEIWSIV